MLSSLMMNWRRLASTSIRLDTRMKQLNDQKKYRQAMALFDALPQEKQPSTTTLAVDQAMRACLELNDLQRGVAISEKLSLTLMKNIFVQSRLIRLHMKCGNVAKAKEIFGSSSKKPLPMYTNMLNGLLENERANEALDLFRRMSLPANEYILSTVFKICAQLGDASSLEYGQNVFKTMSKTCRNDPIVLNSALKMFLKSGDMLTSEEIFSKISRKSAVTYSIMMNGYILNNMPQKAIDLFFTIEHPDRVTFSILFNACARLGTSQALAVGKQVFSTLPLQYQRAVDVLHSLSNMFIKCGDVKSAESLFDRLQRDVKCYGSLMKMYNSRNEMDKTLKLFQRMEKEHIEPNDLIFVLLIDACSETGDLSLCESIMPKIPKDSLSNLWILNSLVDMWGKVGEAARAKQVFDGIVQPDAVSFAAMINSYGLNGMGIESVELFHQTPRDLLNSWIYVCVLNACSHSGLVDQAHQIFATIPIEEKTERIYTTMVDVLSRANHCDEAQSLVEQFENRHSPYLPMYISILSAARNQRNTSLSQTLFDRIKHLFPEMKSGLTSAHVLLANTYAATGDFYRASNIRMQITELGLKRRMGVSRTMVNGEITTFAAHDRSHPLSNAIDLELEQVTKKLIDHGHVFDRSWITRALENDETVQSVLCGHSERLAIGFNLIQRPIPRRIQIVEDLRICGDCHAVTKLIAKFYGILIVIRDANRVHHFHPDGECSCKDYF